jgi:heat shock protein HspQ
MTIFRAGKDFRACFWVKLRRLQCRHRGHMTEIIRNAKFLIGQVVRHRIYAFRGVIYDVDPTFSNSEEWWNSIPEDVRPRKDQPYYHLLAENAETSYVAYVSEQNLLQDESGTPVNHPDVGQYFGKLEDGYYELDPKRAH